MGCFCFRRFAGSLLLVSGVALATGCRRGIQAADGPSDLPPGRVPGAAEVSARRGAAWGKLREPRAGGGGVRGWVGGGWVGGGGRRGWVGGKYEKIQAGEWGWDFATLACLVPNNEQLVGVLASARTISCLGG